MDEDAKPSAPPPQTHVILRDPLTGEGFAYRMNKKGWLTRVSEKAPPGDRVAPSTNDEIEI